MQGTPKYSLQVYSTAERYSGVGMFLNGNIQYRGKNTVIQIEWKCIHILQANPYMKEFASCHKSKRFGLKLKGFCKSKLKQAWQIGNANA